jgi:hypothetical protein
MSDLLPIPPEERELLVVYPTSEAAEQARARAIEMGVDPSHIRLGEESDVVASLRAEMHEELTHAWIVPNAALIATKESVKGMGLVGGVAVAIGLAVAIPLAFIDWGYGSFWIRLAWFAVVAIAAGGTVGFVAGAAAAAKRPSELAGAHRGTVVRVSDDTPEIRRALVELKPIRMDEVTHGDTPIDTITTEEQSEPEGVIEEVTANLGGDDYQPEVHPERSANQTSHDEP